MHVRSRAIALAIAPLVVAASTLPFATAASAADSPGVARAKQIVAKYAPNPKSIGLTVAANKLPKVPAKGKFVIAIGSGSQSSKQFDSWFAEAAQTLGWTYKEIVGAGSPEKNRASFQQALDLKPDGIFFGGLEPSSFGSDLVARSTAQNTAVVCVSCVEPAPAKNWEMTILGPRDKAIQAQAVAAGMVASTNGKIDAQILNLPAFPALTFFDSQLVRALKAMAPTATVTVNNFTPTQIGTQIPSATVSILQRDPSTNWVFASLGDMFIGVEPALNAAGLGGGRYHMAAANPANIVVTGLKSGFIAASSAGSTAVGAWRAADQMARFFQKQPFVVVPVPTQLLTNVNVAKAVIDPATNAYLGVADYQNQFKKIWGIK